MKVKLFIKVIFVLLFLSFNNLKAQDIHFTQFTSNPISYNPANTGFYKGNYRIGLNHKQQWPWAVKGKFTNYISTSAYTDFTFLDAKWNPNDWAGIGLNFINDQAGDGNLSINKVNLALAYHKGLDRDHKHFLSLGFTAAYVRRAINFKALYFNNQWEDRVGFNLELPNYEYLSTESFSYLDLAVGLQARNQLINDWTITYGLSILHLNTPNESFYNQSNAIGLRYIAHIMSENKLSESVMLQSSAYFTYQKKAIEALIGISAIIAFKSANNKKQSKLIGGLLYRYNDALSPVLGYQYYKTKITTNFDFNLSSLTKASKGNGGFEIAITQVGLWNNKLPSQRKMNCYEF